MSEENNTIRVHPLVLVALSDHYTRNKVHDPTKRVIGMLLGSQEGRVVDVKNTFELVLNVAQGQFSVDQDYTNQKLDSLKQVFPDQDVVGWYEVDRELCTEATDMYHVIRQQWNENPFCILFDPSMVSGEVLPLRVYGGERVLLDDRSVFQFTTWNDVTVETTDAERIVVNHTTNVARVSTGTNQTGHTESKYMDGVRDSMKMLSKRLQVLIHYLERVENGSLQPDPRLLRECRAIVHMLPSRLVQQTDDKTHEEMENVLLQLYLSSMTSGLRDAEDRTRQMLEQAKDSKRDQISDEMPMAM